MFTQKYCIGISCIGSGVGQSVITSCRLSHLPIYTIGLGNNPYGFGMYECDEFAMTPSIYDENFFEKLIQRCKDKNIDLLIPGRDDEVLFFAQNEDLFSGHLIKAIIPGIDLIQLCRDKAAMCMYFNQIVDSFVETYTLKCLLELPDPLSISFPLIAKPRDGYASKGIKIINTFDDLKNLNPNFIIQELAIPRKADLNYKEYINLIKKGENPQISEISIQLVAGVDGRLIGKMASYNRLSNGVPIEVLPIDNNEVWDVVTKILPELNALGFRGPLNIQGRLTEKGFKIFEMNPRFTGITGLRAIMGFNEVESCIQSWLGLPVNDLFINQNRFGVRQTTDKAIDFSRNCQVDKHSRIVNAKYLNEHGNKILITGATGFLGRHFIELLRKEHYTFSILSTHKSAAVNLFPDLPVFDVDDLENGLLDLGRYDYLIHLGFERKQNDFVGIAESLSFTNNLFISAVLHQIPSIINISSQSVYGLDKPPYWKETDSVSPQSPYSSAKFATELILQGLKVREPQVRGTSIRLAALSGGNIEGDDVELINKLVAQIINDEQITIHGGHQRFERLDVRDAAKGILTLMKLPSIEWKPVYNLGSQTNYSLLFIAEHVLNISRKYCPDYSKGLKIIKKDDDTAFGMNSELFIQSTNWSPDYDIERIIDSVYSYQMLKGEN